MEQDKKILSEDKLEKTAGGDYFYWYAKATCYKCFESFEIEGEYKLGTIVDCKICGAKGSAKTGESRYIIMYTS